MRPIEFLMSQSLFMKGMFQHEGHVSTICIHHNETVQNLVAIPFYEGHVSTLIFETLINSCL